MENNDNDLIFDYSALIIKEEDKPKNWQEGGVQIPWHRI